MSSKPSTFGQGLETRGRKRLSELENEINDGKKDIVKSLTAKKITLKNCEKVKNGKKDLEKNIKWQQIDIVRQRYYTTAEVMTMLSFSRHTVYGFAENKTIPSAIKIGGHWRFPVFEFERWLEHTHLIYRTGRYKKTHLLDNDDAIAEAKRLADLKPQERVRTDYNIE